MKIIPLTRGHVALVDDSDYEELAAHKWHATSDGRLTLYAARNVRRSDGVKRISLMHREILNVERGAGIDHANRNGIDNQRSNLRAASPSLNQANRVLLEARNTSGRRGVYWNQRRHCWQAYIYRSGKHIYLGAFASVDDAARAYDAAARELFGEYARPNFPEITSAAELMRSGSLQGFGT